MAPVRLSALLGHPSAGHVRLLTPDLGAAGLVRHVVLTRDVTARPELSPETVLVVLDDVDRTDWRLDALVNRARAAQISALLLPGQEPLSLATTQLATRLELPVLGSADPLHTYTTLSDLLTRPLVEQARIVRATVNMCTSAGEDPADVVRGLGEVLERPVALIDHTARAVVGPDLVHTAQRDRLIARLTQRPPAPPHVITEPVDEGELVAMSITAARGWLCVSLPTPLPVEREAVMEALPVAASALRERFAERRLRLERDARARTSALEEVTRHPTTLSTALRRRALDLGWQLDGWHVGIYVGLGAELDLTTARADLVAAFAGEDLTVQAVEQVDGWAVWTTTAGEPSSEDAVRHAAAVRRAQRRLEAGSALSTYVGVGRARVGPEGLANSLVEARDAARLARSREETGRFLHVDRLGFGQLLLGWTRTDSFRPAANALLDPLTGAPGDLVNTLRAYLDCESSLAHTAAVLGVHRNTVAARITRVQQLLGVDLTNPDERLALHLACKSLQVPEETVHDN